MHSTKKIIQMFLATRIVLLSIHGNVSDLLLTTELIQSQFQNVTHYRVKTRMKNGFFGGKYIDG